MMPHPRNRPDTPGASLGLGSADESPADGEAVATTRDAGARGLPVSSPDLSADAAALCATLALCVVEIIAGVRALEQIGRWVTDSVYIHILRRMVIAARYRAVAGVDERRPRVRVGKPMVSLLGDTVAEAVVMVHQPTRSRAVAIRLERHRSRWRASAIHVI